MLKNKKNNLHRKIIAQHCVIFKSGVIPGHACLAKFDVLLKIGDRLHVDG